MEIYGVLSFVAPEMLQNGMYTKAADIYGFGMIMWELISGEPPFSDRDYDANLALEICDGERPPIPEYAPEIYIKIIKMCWDPIPVNRPSIGVIYIMLNILYSLLEVGIEFMEMKFKNPNIFHPHLQLKILGGVYLDSIPSQKWT